MRVRRTLGRLIGIVVMVVFAAAPSAAQGPKKGGVLRVGMIGEPPTLDVHMTTAVITREMAVNMFEGLYALDAKYQPAPLLAEGHELLDGGKRYAIRLRKDVKFHNGKLMTSTDVVASLKRWGITAGTGKATFKVVEAIEAKGPNAIEIRLKEPSGSLLTVLGSIDNAPLVYPKEVIDAAGEGPLKEWIGTGPFKFVEHKPDRHVRLARFDGYVPRGEPASGLAGKRTAYVDEILFIPVPDYATRQAGMVTGEYDYIQQVKPDQYDRLKSSPGVETVVVKPYGWATIAFNLKQGLMTDVRLRQAVQAALDVEPMILAGVGHKDFYRIDPGLFFQETPWHSKIGANLYNQHDKAKAQRLMKEAGYAGQPIRWIVTTEYEHHYKPAVVAKGQLEAVGFKVDLQVSDWATVVQRRNKPELWDAFSTAFVFVPEPATSSQVLCEWPGWWCTPEKDALLQALGREADFKKRYAIWEKVQAMFYAEAPRIKIGDYFRLDARRKDVMGYEPGPYMHFWNVWLNRK
jgi:peptide/nickel transport system substrate-binding protein